MSCGAGRRLGSDLVLLWLWCRLAAVAPIRPLAWEPPYGTGVALKRQKDKRKEKRREEEKKRKGKKRKEIPGVPAVAKWVRDPTLSLQWLRWAFDPQLGSVQWVKDRHCPHRGVVCSHCRFRFRFLAQELHMLQVWGKKKKKKKQEKS